MPSIISLTTIGGSDASRTWQFDEDFDLGRSNQTKLPLSESSVSRKHAEIFWGGDSWQLRDLGSSNGTFVNDLLVSHQPASLRSGDIILLGAAKLRVEVREVANASGGGDQLEEVNTVQTLTGESYQKIVADLTETAPQENQADKRVLALLRAGFHLGHHQSVEELVDGILNEVLHVLDAQRSAIALLNEDGDLELRAVKMASGDRPGRFSFSRSLARTCLAEGTSILCASSSLDRELKGAPSVLAGDMNSILCVLLRTPKNRLGILHLDRNPSQEIFTYDDLQLADTMAACVSAGLENAQLIRQQQEWFLSTLNTLAQAVELRDPYTAGHAQRVTRYSLRLGKHLRLPAKDLHWLATGTPLHDIGKIGIDDAILRKPAPLSEEEFHIMQSHTVKGEEMLKHVDKLFPILPIVRSHHERWDGLGYPDKLAGEGIPFLARIVAVADTFDAMTTDRPYRDGMSFEVAAAEIHAGSGTQFDPVCSEAFFNIRNLLEEDAFQSRANPQSLQHADDTINLLSAPITHLAEL